MYVRLLVDTPVSGVKFKWALGGQQMGACCIRILRSPVFAGSSRARHSDEAGDMGSQPPPVRC
jgi:hypothetical protein